MGRPRSELAHLKVLEAAGRLFAEHGIDATSMDAIAEASGVSKATIYKHWPDKPALCLEVVSHLHASEPQPPLQVTDDVRGDIVAFLDRTPTRPRSDVRSRMMPHVWAYAVRTPEFGEVWRRRFVDTSRESLVALLRRAVEEGRLDPTLDLELAAIGLIGPIIYRNLTRLTGGTAPPDLAERTVDMLWKAYGTSRHRRPTLAAR